MITPEQITLAENAAQDLDQPTTPADIALRRHFELCDHCTDNPWDLCATGELLVKAWEKEKK